MNISQLRTKRVIVPAVAAAAILVVGGTIWSAAADDSVDGSERDRVSTAAQKAAGGGKAVDVETSDDIGEAYDVEVRFNDGREVDIALDKDLKVVTKEEDGYDDRDDKDDTPDLDDRTLSNTERTSAEKAALAAVGGGTVVDVEASDDPGVAYELEVRDAKNVEWDIDLGADFSLVAKVRDD